MLGGVRGPSKVHNPLLIVLFISCSLMTAYSTLLQRKCLPQEENLGCLLVRNVWYLPSSISRVPEKEKVLSR